MAAVLAFAPPVGAQERRAGTVPTMVVRGSGIFKAKPDVATLVVQVVTTGDTLEKAAKAHEERASRAFTALQKLAADGLEIGSASYSLSQQSPPRPSGTTQRPEPPAFRASTTNHLILRQIDRINDVITRIADTGLLEVRSASFHLQDERHALDEARRDAVRDARAQAGVYAEAADQRLIEVLEIEGDTASGGGDNLASMAVERSVKVVPPAMVSFRANVTIKWRIGPRL
jgi:uncharacterized protein YggE